VGVQLKNGWHLGRISVRFPWPFLTPSTAKFSGGAGSDVYVIDTGIDTTHPAFDGMAHWLWPCDGKGADDNGHGTHCAGSVHAIAPDATIYAVKVLPKSGGTFDMFREGCERIIARHKTSGRASVANMSLVYPGATGELQNGLCAIIKKMLDAGIVVVCAAGNYGNPFASIDVYPAEANDVVTVGATDYNRNNLGMIWPDVRAQFSDYGVAVKIFAPGVGIWSTEPGGGWGSRDGTSMAAPQVAGVLACAIPRCNDGASVKSALEEFYATQPRRLVRDVRGCFNRFLYAAPN
jgi:subtilisin family serine protease